MEFFKEVENRINIIKERKKKIRFLTEAKKSNLVDVCFQVQVDTEKGYYEDREKFNLDSHIPIQIWQKFCDDAIAKLEERIRFEEDEIRKLLREAYDDKHDS